MRLHRLPDFVLAVHCDDVVVTVGVFTVGVGGSLRVGTCDDPASERGLVTSVGGLQTLQGS